METPARENGLPARHHFLYYIFSLDKAAHPMPAEPAERARQELQTVLNDFEKGKR